MSNGNGHHWSKFSWRDWHSDIALHPCSLAARGFWVELLCMMHEGSPVGHLANNGRQVTVRQMASNAGCSEKEASRLLAELEAAGVFSRTADGTIYSRRMVKDAIASGKGAVAAEKRWSGHKPNGSPNGAPNREAIGQPYGEPNAKSQSQSREEPPPYPPRDRGGRGRGFKNGALALIVSQGFETATAGKSGDNNDLAEQTRACLALKGLRYGSP